MQFSHGSSIPGTTWTAVARQSVDVALRGAREQAAGATAIALILLLLAIFFSALVAAFPLPDEAEPAPVFEA